jgi:hypothetical protein
MPEQQSSANDPLLPFPAFGLEEDEFEMFKVTYDKLKENFPLTYDGNFEFDFSVYNICEGYSDIYFVPFEIKAGEKKGYICFTHVTYIRGGGKSGYYHGNEYQGWGIAELHNDFGHVLIREETIGDKIVELLKPIELDFAEDRKFSNKFYVLAEDKTKAERALSPAFREAIMKLGTEYEIEIIGNRLIIGNKKLLEPDTAMVMAGFIEEVANMR